MHLCYVWHQMGQLEVGGLCSLLSGAWLLSPCSVSFSRPLHGTWGSHCMTALEYLHFLHGNLFLRDGEWKLQEQLRTVSRSKTASLPSDSLGQSSQRTCPDPRSWRNRLYLLIEVEDKVTLQKKNGWYCCGRLWKNNLPQENKSKHIHLPEGMTFFFLAQNL